jgi:PAS domain S-box-containing protein
MNTPDLDTIFDLLIRHSSSCSVLVDSNGNVLRFNDAYQKLLGYEYDDVNENVSIVYESKESMEREHGLMSELLDGRRSDIKYQSTRVAKNGRIIPVEVTALLFTNREGKPDIALKRLEDITGKMESDQITMNQIFFVKKVLDEIPLSFYFKDTNSRFLLNSREHAHFLGASDPQSMKGKSDVDFFPEVHAKRAFDDEQEIMRTGKSLDIVEEITAEDGSIRWAQTLKSPLRDLNGEILGTYGVTRDITDLKRAENALHLKNKELQDTIEELNRTQNRLIFAEKMAALGSLIGGIAHEINTPLGAIKASSSNIGDVVQKISVDLPWLFEHASHEETTWLFKLFLEADARDISVFSKEERQRKRELTSLLEEHQIENAAITADTIVSLKLNYTDDVYLAFLNQPHAHRLLNILKTLFSLKRNGNNISVSVEKAADVVRALKSYIYKNNTGDFEAADLTDTINTVLILTANMIKHTKTVVTTELESVPPVFCRQDELCQVWTNLITNAIQAMGESGTLDISMTYDTVRESIITRFKDSGPGIPESIKARIFEPYFTTKPKGIGTGMGLDISKQIIEKHKGTIVFESEPGQGTTFIIEIPINQER